jgi:hypothetical protein
MGHRERPARVGANRPRRVGSGGGVVSSDVRPWRGVPMGCEDSMALGYVLAAWG